jgi:two-component sensor histidine kinase
LRGVHPRTFVAAPSSFILNGDPLSPLLRAFSNPKSNAVQIGAATRLGWFRALLLQALIWVALTVAFAALLRLAGPQNWSSALRFASMSWLPWVLLAPVVYWLSGRFPLERAHLWKSIPAHVVGCAACVVITITASSYIGYVSRQSGPRFDERRPPPRPLAEREIAPAASALETPGNVTSTSSATTGDYGRRERFDGYTRGEGRSRRGLFWWPFLGVTLLRANFDAAVYLIVVVAAHALAFYRRAQEREQHAIALAAGLTRAKLDALRLQLQPHFLFNTLNAISTLVHRDANAADELIGDLSDLLRVSLQTSDHEVSLRRELELLDRYLAIEQTRLSDRLRVEKSIDPATENALVPTFLLQPIVENSIRHGIEPRLSGGRVVVRSAIEGGRLLLTVEDDGVGIAAKPNPKARRGIGLTNTQERLQALHGAAAQLEIVSPDSGGVRVQISLPFVTTRATTLASSNPAASSGA